MSLDNEIEKARSHVVSDGYDMSVGEVVNLYRDGEIMIRPEFQRLFRWDESRKTRFIESLLLGIPIPPIFVYQNSDGVWELIDGLQRLSTILEFIGILQNADGDIVDPSTLEGTRFLPSLSGVRWDTGLGKNQQIQIKRSRIRVEILKPESDPTTKYELFQRLNTGGAGLSEQEVRNCVAVMLDPSFLAWLESLATYPSFSATIRQTDYARERQVGTELALRFLSFRNFPYDGKLDVHEYLDEALMKLATDNSFNRESEADIFYRTFDLLNASFGDKAFTKWDGTDFKGMFLMSLFEVTATGVSQNLKQIEGLESPSQFLEDRNRKIWEESVFQKNSGAGVRGTTRLSRLLPLAKDFYNPA